ncbi:hypothetical protein BO222_00250 [Ileibacterium valens]|uniref:Uncharacterized protein n=1 Tax=Ileibacterium valens TaxID=1862668 RepID=A0A1U7NJC0_9FIRM|nr:hypothetical protein BO222_00250 [Ileibacterium valens]
MKIYLSFTSLLILLPVLIKVKTFCEFLFEFHKRKKTSLVRNKPSLTRLIKNTTPAIISQPFLLIIFKFSQIRISALRYKEYGYSRMPFQFEFFNQFLKQLAYLNPKQKEDQLI